MKCQKCGAEVPAGSKFCNLCGEKIEQVALFKDNEQVNKELYSTKKPIYLQSKFYIFLFIAILLCIGVIIAIVQVGQPNVEKTNSINTTKSVHSEISNVDKQSLKSYDITPISVSVPENWTVRKSDEYNYFYNTNNEMFYIYCTESGIDKSQFGTEFMEGISKSFFDGFDNYEELDRIPTYVSDCKAYNIKAIIENKGKSYYANTYIWATNKYVCFAMFNSEGESQSDEFNKYEKIIMDSITVNSTEDVLPTEEETTKKVAESKTEPTTKKVTKGSTKKTTDSPAPKIVNNTSSDGFWANGNGDYVAEGLNVTNYAVLHISHTGSRNFIVKLYKDDEYEDLLVNTIGSYTGDVLVDGSGTYELEISADGDWNITSDGLSIDDTTSFSGTGDSVTGITSHSGGSWHITYSGERNFSVIEYGESLGYMDLLVNEIGSYDGTVKAESGDNIFFKVHSYGNWTIKKK